MGFTEILFMACQDGRNGNHIENCGVTTQKNNQRHGIAVRASA